MVMDLLLLAMAKAMAKATRWLNFAFRAPGPTATPPNFLEKLLPWIAKPLPALAVLEPSPGLLFPTAWLVGATLACLVIAWLALRRDAGTNPTSPGMRSIQMHPAPRLPLIGLPWQTFRLSSDNQTYDMSRLRWLGGKDGLCAVDFGYLKMIFVHSPETIKQVFTDHPFVDGGAYQPSGFAKVMTGLPGIEVFTYLFAAKDDDRQWPIAHRILIKPFSRQGMMSMVPLMNEQARSPPTVSPQPRPAHAETPHTARRRQADMMVDRLQRDLVGGLGPLRIYDYTVMMAVETLGTCCMGMPFESFSGESVPFLQHLKRWLNTNSDVGSYLPAL